MSEDKKAAPEWGDIVHINGQPLVIIDCLIDYHFKVANRRGDVNLFMCEEFDEYKPCTITINGMEVPEPERKILRLGQKYWIADITGGTPLSDCWGGFPADYRWLENGLIHLTKENAEAHRNAIIRANKGESG